MVDFMSAIWNKSTLFILLQSIKNTKSFTEQLYNCEMTTENFVVYFRFFLMKLN
jgi:hypothetical protein